MRFYYLVSLLLAIAIGLTYWYQSTSYICPAPLAYRVGNIDDSFAISIEEAKEAVYEATQVWEDSTGRDLFYYDDNADLTVTFVFDERQAESNSKTTDVAKLDAVEKQNEVIKSSLDKLQSSYEEMYSSFETRNQAYESSLVDYEETIRQINDRGGANEKEISELESVSNSLKQEYTELQSLNKKLGDLSVQINKLSEEGNRLIKNYNQQVEQFNNRYGHTEQFTQGDYTEGEIHIYKFKDNNELVTVLAHELGHALAIDHVDDPESIMYYLLSEEKEEAPILSAEDKLEFFEVCQFDTWRFKVHQFIRAQF